MCPGRCGTVGPTRVPGGQTALDNRAVETFTTDGRQRRLPVRRYAIGAWLVPGLLLVIATLLAAREPEAARPA